MEPVDLEEFLTQAGRVKHDILMLCLLADVWEPTACQRLAQTMSWKDTDATDHDDVDVQQTNYDILCIGGVCRHFGFMTLGKCLKLLKPMAGEEMAHRELSGASEPAGAPPTKKKIRREPLRSTEKRLARCGQRPKPHQVLSRHICAVDHARIAHPCR
jgi:hypothetical protein